MNPQTTPANPALTEKRQARIAAGRCAYKKLNSHEHFAEWLQVADALAAFREEAMAQANTNRPFGPHYRNALRKLFDQETWIASIDDATRTHCYWLIDNLPAVQAWRETLTFRQRDEWNHPSTLKRNFDRTHKVEEKPDDVPVRPSLKQLLADAQQEKYIAEQKVRQLERELAAAQDEIEHLKAKAKTEKPPRIKKVA